MRRPFSSSGTGTRRQGESCAGREPRKPDSKPVFRRKTGLGWGQGADMGKVVMVVSDALRDDTARRQMGYLEHLVEVSRATRYTVVAELPTMSRPLYETLHTGVPVGGHGVTNN